MKCPVCGSANVHLELGFIVKCEVQELNGVFRGQIEEERVPDFVCWVCDDCGDGGELIDDAQLNIFAKAKLTVKAEWAPNIE